jgi:hypothetical protein
MRGDLSRLRLPGHDEDGTPGVLREERIKRLTRGISSDDDGSGPPRQFLHLMEKTTMGFLLWHTTDGTPDEAYDDPASGGDWRVWKTYDLDTGKEA